MKMPVKYLHEITDDWNTDFVMPNHIYLLESTTCVGYIQQGTEIEVMFSKPLKNFDKKRRKFKELKTRKAVNTIIDGWLVK